MPAHRSKTPQLEDGYTKIADELLEAFCRASLGGREYAVLLAIIRMTYGWQKKRDRIASSQIEKLTGIPSRKIGPILRSLKEKGLVRIENSGQGRIPTLSILKDHRKWKKRIRVTSPQKGGGKANKPTPIMGPTSPPEGVGSSPQQGVDHREIKTSIERVVRFGRLKKRLTKKKVAALVAMRPGGALYSEDDVQAWFLATEPVMIAKGYKSTLRCAVNWFRRVRPEEIRRAVMWVEAQAMEELRDQEDDRDKDSLSDFAEAFGL